MTTEQQTIERLQAELRLTRALLECARRELAEMPSQSIKRLFTALIGGAP